MRRVFLLIWCSVIGLASAHPQRIVSLKPNITELLFALGAGDRVVGDTTWCDAPEAARRLPKIADYIRPNVEAIVSLRPDLVVGSTENSPAGPIAQLRALQIPVALFSFATLADTLQSIAALGDTIGAAPHSRALVQQLTHELTPRTLAPSPRVLLLVGVAPPIAAGPGSIFGELLARTGAINVITAPTPAYPQLSEEGILALHPHTMVIAASDATTATFPFALPSTVHLAKIDPNLFRPGPRLPLAFQALQNVMHRDDWSK